MMAEGFNHWGQIANALPKVLSQVVRKTAFDGKANIQKRIQTNGQIDTGFMFGSVYVVTSEESTYRGGEKALPEIGKPEDDQTAYVAVAAEYAAPQNYGTRYLPPRPFFEPGMDDTRPGFEAALSAIESKLI